MPEGGLVTSTNSPDLRDDHLIARLKLAAAEPRGLIRDARILEARLYQAESAGSNSEPLNIDTYTGKSLDEIAQALGINFLSSEDWLQARLADELLSYVEPAAQATSQTTLLTDLAKSLANLVRGGTKIISVAAMEALRNVGALHSETSPALSASGVLDDDAGDSTLIIEGPLGIKGNRRDDGTFRFSCPRDRIAELEGQFLTLTLNDQTWPAGPFKNGVFSWTPGPGFFLKVERLHTALLDTRKLPGDATE